MALIWPNHTLAAGRSKHKMSAPRKPSGKSGLIGFRQPATQPYQPLCVRDPRHDPQYFHRQQSLLPSTQLPTKEPATIPTKTNHLAPDSRSPRRTYTQPDTAPPTKTRSSSLVHARPPGYPRVRAIKIDCPCSFQNPASELWRKRARGRCRWYAVPLAVGVVQIVVVVESRLQEGEQGGGIATDGGCEHEFGARPNSQAGESKSRAPLSARDAPWYDG